MSSVAATPERWHKQTIVGGGDVPPEERGDCVRACITSVLGVPIAALPNIHGDAWWVRLQDAVGKLGYSLAVLDMDAVPPRSYWIATVPSLNLPPEPDGEPALHCIVACGFEFVHDPAIGERQYDAETWGRVFDEGKVDSGWALVPLDVAVSRG